jgi:16S rRNA (cytosine1402-N4)-methyltransferase
VNEHAPVLLQEAIEGLQVRPVGVYVDCTFGRGGHSRLILSKLGPEGTLVALDRDPEAVRAAASIDDPRFIIIHAAFGRIAEVLAARRHCSRARNPAGPRRLVTAA